MIYVVYVLYSYISIPDIESISGYIYDIIQHT